jgi:2'-5' RNA ligase
MVIDLPPEARAALAAVGEQLSQHVAEKAVKWVAPARIHLTLRFLDKTPVDQLETIYEGLDRAAAQQAPFRLVLDSLGCFPNERRPRVIWVGVGGDTGQVEALQQGIEEMLQPLGWEPESRPFHPHLTLGRVKDKRAQIDLPWGQGVAPAEFPVREVHVYESELRRSGPIYTVRHTSALRGEGP